MKLELSDEEAMRLLEAIRLARYHIVSTDGHPHQTDSPWHARIQWDIWSKLSIRLRKLRKEALL